MANGQLLGKASEVLGEQARDVVLLQNRPKTALLALLVLWAPIVLNLGLLPIVMAAGAAGVLYSVLTNYRAIASTPTRLVLMKVDKISVRARPSEIECELVPSDVELTDKAGINRTVLVKGQKYILSRVLVGRLQTMLDQAR